MQISGFQKLTLLDYPGKTACTVFTAGCNFRCPFCHNAGLVLGRAEPVISEDEFFAYLKKRQGLLDGVAVTGGEPLQQKDIASFLERVRALGYDVKLDTNGTDPERLRGLVEAGLVQRVAMDIKNAPSAYGLTVGMEHAAFDRVEKTKDYLLSGVVPYEFRTTVVRGLHTEERMIELAQWIAGAQEYWLQQFRDTGSLICGEGLSQFGKEEMEAFAEAMRPYVGSVRIRES